MGLLEEMFAKKKETPRSRTVKATPVKKDPEKTPKPVDKIRSSTQSSSFLGSLKRVQGAVTATSKTSTPKRNDVIKSKTPSGLKIKPPQKEKDKEKRPWYRSSPKNLVKKDPIRSSTASLNVGSNVQKSAVDPKIRPVSLFSSSNVTYRRGQNPKIDGHNLGDNLSRTSSVTNLDADQKGSKGARPRKSASRDRIDKIGDGKKHDKKGLNKNNNKLDAVENTYPSVDSLPEEELLHLRRQLQEMAQEKSNLALQLGEQKGQLNNLQKEIQKLKLFQDESNIQMDQLTEENSRLRKRLKDVAHSPLSDNEKQQLLFNTHRHHHSSSAPASIATNIIEDESGPDTTCTTPDWDKHSSGNISEVSVACLQDKINQMQETHYSTNEELQATLQELTDLQRQLTELQQENERLNDEKNLMFDSLCRQTERLNDSRSEVESLKQLLYQEKDDTGQYESAIEREQKLVDLIKSAQEDKEELLVKLEQLNNETQEARTGNISKDEQIVQLRDRVRTLECTLDAKHAEHKLLDQELAQAKDQCSGKQIEINRLTDLLDNARTKINELEQDRAMSDKSELDELLDNARKEKDALESEVAHLKEQLAISKNEIEKLKEQVSILQEECKVTRNNAKTTQSDLEYKCEKLQKDKNVLNDQLQEFQEAVNELQVQSQCQLEDKRQLSSVLSETQRNLSEAERRNQNMENDLEELKKHIARETADWEKFQDDLLTSVRVANDFKTEAQQELQRMILENKAFRDREKQLRAEIEKLKGETSKRGQTRTTLSSKDDQKMDILIKRPNRNKNVTKKSKDGYSTQSSSSKYKQSTPHSSPRPVKRREIKSSKQKRLKTLSVEEETLLKSLDTYNKSIDKNIPDENLTEEQRVIRKLKVIYEDELLRVKPVAPKAKDQLAISKPLLDSVLCNPKLLDIIRNVNVRTIEDMAIFAKETPEINTLIQGIDRTARGKSEDFGKSVKRVSVIGRSMSYDDMYELKDIDYNSKLYRTVEAEDLTREILLSAQPREPSIEPSDSASNRRYSDFALDVNKDNEKNYKKNLNYSTLNRIVKSIPKNTPESQLTKEQKFALRLSHALEEGKNTLKKLANAKALVISTPTLESVIKNPKLEEILYDPDIIEVRRRNSDTPAPSNSVGVLRTSKSYDDINFAFNSSGTFVDYPIDLTHPFDSSSDYSSAEFNLDTGLTGPYNPKVFEAYKPDEIYTSLGSEAAQREQHIIGDNSQDTNVSGDCVKVKFSTFLGSKEGQETKKIQKFGRVSDSLTYNDTLNKPKEISKGTVGEAVFIENTPRVDLLQEKIRKIMKNEQKPISVNKGDINTTQGINRDVINKNTIKYDSLVYNDTLNKKLKSETGCETNKWPNIDTLSNSGELSCSKLKQAEVKFNRPDLSEVPTDAVVEMADISESLTDDEPINQNIKNNTDNSTKSNLSQSDISDIKNDQHYVDDIQVINKKLEVIHKLISEDKNDMFENNQTPIDFVTSDKDSTQFKSHYRKFHTDVSDTKHVGSFSGQNYVLEFGSGVHKSNQLLNKTEGDVPSMVNDNERITHTHFDLVNSDTTDGRNEENSPEYDYHSILRENRFGVKPPLNYRLSYKNVVHEIKKRFSTDDHEFEMNQNIDPENEDTTGNIFTLRRTYGMESLDIEDPDQHYKNATTIDKEMDDIFQNYLHTRVSKIIKESEVKPLVKIKNSSKVASHVPAVEKPKDELDGNVDDRLRHDSLLNIIPVPKPRKLHMELGGKSDSETDETTAGAPTSYLDIEHVNSKVVVQSINESPTATTRNIYIDSFAFMPSVRNQEVEDIGANKKPSYEFPLNDQIDLNRSSDNEVSKTPSKELTILNQRKNESIKRDDTNITVFSVEKKSAPNETFVESIQSAPTILHPVESYTVIQQSPELQACQEKSNIFEPLTNISRIDFKFLETGSNEPIKEQRSTEIKVNIDNNSNYEDIEKPLDNYQFKINRKSEMQLEKPDTQSEKVELQAEKPEIQSGKSDTESENLEMKSEKPEIHYEKPNTQSQIPYTQSEKSYTQSEKSYTQSGKLEMQSEKTKQLETDSPIVWEQSDHDCEPLTEDEVLLVNRVKKQRLSRPLSDFNVDDIEFIKRISFSHSLENEHPETYQQKSVDFISTEELVPVIDISETEEKNRTAFDPDTSKYNNIDNEKESANDSTLLKSYVIPKEYYNSDHEGHKVTPALSSDKSHQPLFYDCSDVIPEKSYVESSYHQIRPSINKKDQTSDNTTNIPSEGTIYPLPSIPDNTKRIIDNKTKCFESLPKDSRVESNVDKTNKKHDSTIESEKPDDLDALLLKMTSRSRSPRSKSTLKVQRTDSSPAKKEYKEIQGNPGKNISAVDNKPQETLQLRHESPSSDPVVLRTTLQSSDGRISAIHRRSSSIPISSVFHENSETNSNKTRKERPKSATKVVKAFAQHFERISLDKSKIYQPVYAHNPGISKNISKTSTLAQNTKKTSLPVPSYNNQASEPRVRSGDISHNIDNNVEDLATGKMVGNGKNFSDNEHSVPQGVSAVELCQKDTTEVPGLHESHTFSLELPQEGLAGTEQVLGEAVTAKKSEKLMENMIPPNDDDLKKEVDDQENLASGTSTKYSTIQIAGKSEQLDITKISESVNEDTVIENVSDVNFFNLENSSYEDSYLSLFKTPEDKAMEHFSKKKPKKGYLNITYLGEVSDSESFDDIDGLERNFLHGSGSKPKIIDFVPLDEATKPVFEKEDLPKFNTLEREETFQVFNSAAASTTKGNIQKRDSSASAKLKQSSSRSSFSAAKKLFEELQAKSDNKTDKQVAKRASLNEKLNNVDIAKSSNTGSVKKTVEELEK